MWKIKERWNTPDGRCFQLRKNNPLNFLCPGFPHKTVTETRGTLVEAWYWRITFQSKVGPPWPAMMHCSRGAHPLRRSWAPDPHLSLPPALALAVSQLLVTLTPIRSWRCFQWIYQSVCIHICAHIFRNSLMFYYDKGLTLSQPLRWSCSLSHFIFSSFSNKVIRGALP